MLLFLVEADIVDFDSVTQALRKARHDHEEELKLQRIVANEQLERQKRAISTQWALKLSQEVQKAEEHKEEVSN